jgi:isoleucyl-tRNA synthetase
MSTNAKPYKDTLNLPTTAFDMKANLTVREPKMQARWRENDLYGQIRKARAGRERKVLHDGPPYANGEIHMGHLLNKVLKDFVVRSLTMRGYDSPYVPGWDCHGLPIEHKVVKDLGSKAAALSQSEVRALCQTEAMKWVGIQRDQFRRLGIDGDWENPYLTLDPRYEAGIMDVLADLVEGGYVFRQLKPIHWDVHDRTALAEAELEYQDVTSTTVYVNFPFSSGVPASLDAHSGEAGRPIWHAMIWTTTPWTLPANVAIAAHPDLDYVGIRYTDPETGQVVHTVLAADLVAKVAALKGVVDVQEVARFKGRELEGAKYRHVFLPREGRFVLADYVSADDGTGLVHTAPGHGTEDYKTGQHYGLPTLSPVDASGRFTDEAPERLVGKSVFAANPEVVAMLKESESLFHEMPIRHSYPHGWRSKKPVIFRATYQWFIGVERNDLRQKTLDAIAGVNWLPSWGRSRIDAMVGNRPDWCISRQRAWGVPIPVLSSEETGYHHLTGESVRFYRDLFRNEGTDAWFRKPVSELIPPDLDTAKYPVETLRKGSDILDVWFESGSSHRAVLREPSYNVGPFPAFLYLEGSDQHRGWFQSSILTAVGTTGKAPFENVLTHGFILDDKGHKMSKSGGNAISAVKATEQYGADVLRLYVASLDYADDLWMSERGIKETSEAYRKIRNTFRYLLGNLDDYKTFDPSTVDLSTLYPEDRWALGQLNKVIRDVTEAFDRFEFYKAYQRIYQFCSVTLSSFYLDVLKDRLYAELPDGLDRRAAQYVLAKLHVDLVRMLAPLMPHTAEEIWDVLPDRPEKAASVHLADWPVADSQWDDEENDGLFEDILQLREIMFAGIEGYRKSKVIGSNQEATATALLPGPIYQRLAQQTELTTRLCIVSELILQEAPSGPEGAPTVVSGGKSTHPKCERCWNLRSSVGQDGEHPTLCDRCTRVIRAIEQG